jgi:YgiT-type zinc finger domain-containing protein
MKCIVETCSGEYEDRDIAHSMEVKGELIVIDNVPALVCPVCGNVLMAEETVAALSRIVAEVEAGKQ